MYSFSIIYHYRLLQDIEYSSLCCNKEDLVVYFIYSSVYLLIPSF